MVSDKTLRLILGSSVAALAFLGALLIRQPSPAIPVTLAENQRSQSIPSESHPPNEHLIPGPSSPASSAWPTPSATSAQPSTPTAASSANQDTVNPAAAARAAQIAEIAAHPMLPVIFVDPLPEDQLDDNQEYALQSMRENFQAALHDAQNQQYLAPDSPEYYARWKELQADFDTQYQAEFGRAAFLKYQQIANQRSDLMASQPDGAR